MKKIMETILNLIGYLILGVLLGAVLMEYIDYGIKEQLNQIEKGNNQ